MSRPFRAIRALLSGLIVGTSATAADQPRDHHVDHDHLPEPKSARPASEARASATGSGAAGRSTPGLAWTASMTDKITMSDRFEAVVIRPTPSDDLF